LRLRKELRDKDVEKIILESVILVKEAQLELGLFISPTIDQTKLRLQSGNLKADYLHNKKNKKYSFEYGSFIPPATILLDKKLPFCDKPLDMPQFCETMIYYSAVHEIIHADDHTRGDELLLATRHHILDVHNDKLETSMKILREKEETKCIQNYEDLASLWSIQYVDMVTHYRAYIVLRHKKYKKLDRIWTQLDKEYFPPNLLTCIEIEKGTDYVFSLFTEKIGDYCLIEALEEYKTIKDKNVCSYTI
jgi:hypothetical protein